MVPLRVFLHCRGYPSKHGPQYHTGCTSQRHTAAAHFRDVNGGRKILFLHKRDVLLGVYLCKSLGHLTIGGICEHLTEERVGKGGVDEGRTERI